MGRLIWLSALFLCLCGVVWEYLRFTQFEKDVVYHHSSLCSKTDHGTSVLDLTRYGDWTLGIADDMQAIFNLGEKSVSDGHILVIKGLKSGGITIDTLQIDNFPKESVAFHPRGLYLFHNSTLFVLNFAYSRGNTRIEVLNVTEETPKGNLKLAYFGFITVPENLQGKVGDLIVNEEGEIYLSQYSSAKDNGDGSSLMMIQYMKSDFFGLQESYVHHCKYEYNATATCRALNNTAAVSITGISKDKFGDYFVAYGSMDYNWIGVYDRNWRNGNLELKHKVPIRDRAEKIDWDEGWQRTYAGVLPYPHLVGSSQVPGGAIEMKTWDFRGGYIYRSLMMQDGSLIKGGTCAARQGDFFVLGSYLDTGLVVCPIASPGN